MSYKLPKFKTIRKVFKVRVLKTGYISKVKKCEKRGDIYWYLLENDDIWYAEFELKEAPETNENS